MRLGYSEEKLRSVFSENQSLVSALHAAGSFDLVLRAIEFS